MTAVLPPRWDVPRALVMGILNVTPDSFSDGGRFFDEGAAIARGLEMFDEGADVVDVGGESTRPGAAPVSEAEELGRVLGVVAALAGRGRVSIDTVKATVAEAAVEAGATLVNDVSASLAGVAAARPGIGWVAMHRRGTPQTMQSDVAYDDLVGEVLGFLRQRADEATAAGVGEVWIDPGIGFAKTAAQNLTLLAYLDRFVATGYPVLVGTSRKSFLGHLLATSDAVGDVGSDDRLEGSVTTATMAMLSGAAMVRVHDVGPTVQAALLAGRRSCGEERVVQPA